MYLADREVIDALLYEIPAPGANQSGNAPITGQLNSTLPSNEDSPLLVRSNDRSRVASVDFDGSAEARDSTNGSSMAAQFEGLNALEVAAVSGAKKFLSQKPIQRIINAIWKGDIIFWSNLRPGSTKRAQIYQRRTTDPYCRLRVPVYLKAFEMLFFFAFLALYYIVLVQRSFHTVTAAEVLLYIWITSFAYNGAIDIIGVVAELILLTMCRNRRILGCRNGLLPFRLLECVGYWYRCDWCRVLRRTCVLILFDAPINIPTY